VRLRAAPYTRRPVRVRTYVRGADVGVRGVAVAVRACLVEPPPRRRVSSSSSQRGIVHVAQAVAARQAVAASSQCVAGRDASRRAMRHAATIGSSHCDARASARAALSSRCGEGCIRTRRSSVSSRRPVHHAVAPRRLIAANDALSCANATSGRAAAACVSMLRRPLQPGRRPSLLRRVNSRSRTTDFQNSDTTTAAARGGGIPCSRHT
jgi:hypothetical protein